MSKNLENSMNEKQRKRGAILTAIESKRQQMAALVEQITELAKQVEGYWVIRKTSLSTGGRMRLPIFDPPVDRRFLLPADALFTAECVAGRDSHFATQTVYKLEVVDNDDDEVFARVTTPWKYKP